MNPDPSLSLPSISEDIHQFSFTCPKCRVPLISNHTDEQRCPSEGTIYRRIDGVWHFLTPDRQVFYDQFIHEYETVRQAEGRESSDPAYYRSLPFKDTSGRMSGDWHIRARSYLSLINNIIEPTEKYSGGPLNILDMGAGNGWLSYRLAQRGHQVAAVDLTTNSFDGLGASKYYDVVFTPVQAEFDALPFLDQTIDLVLFNASFHYSTHYELTLQETLRVLKPNCQFAIIDTPVYHHNSSGLQMVREREAQFEQKYGFPSNTLPSENFLTYDRLNQLAVNLSIKWRMIKPNYGINWSIRPLKARLRGAREPAQFMIIIGNP